MPEILNPFLDNPAFSLASLTAAVNILPNNYGRMGQKNLFPLKGVTNRVIMVEEQNGVLSLLKSEPVGSMGQSSQKSKNGKRKVRSFVVPYLPLEDSVLPQEYEGVRAFGAVSGSSPLVTVINNKLQTMKNKHAITLEFMRMGALEGIILDGDGSVLYNLFTEFDITRKIVFFYFSSDTSDIPQKCRDIVRHIEKNLKGEVMSGVECQCSAEFFDALIKHPTVTEIYKGWAAAHEVLGKDSRNGFTLQGIRFEEYNATATDSEGSERRFIAEGDAHFYPVGMQQSMETICAPADFLETVNTIGLELYTKQEPRKYNKGIDIHMQSNVLPICYRPAVLVRGNVKDK